MLKSRQLSYKSAGILPYCFIEGIPHFLLGCEQQKNNEYLWGDLGGKKTEKDLNDQETAARSCSEETFGVFGSNSLTHGRIESLKNSIELFLGTITIGLLNGTVFQINLQDFVLFLCPTPFIEEYVLSKISSRNKKTHSLKDSRKQKFMWVPVSNISQMTKTNIQQLQYIDVKTEKSETLKLDPKLFETLKLPKGLKSMAIISNMKKNIYKYHNNEQQQETTESELKTINNNNKNQQELDTNLEQHPKIDNQITNDKIDPPVNVKDNTHFEQQEPTSEKEENQQTQEEIREQELQEFVSNNFYMDVTVSSCDEESLEKLKSNRKYFKKKPYQKKRNPKFNKKIIHKTSNGESENNFPVAKTKKLTQNSQKSNNSVKYFNERPYTKKIQLGKKKQPMKIKQMHKTKYLTLISL